MSALSSTGPMFSLQSLMRWPSNYSRAWLHQCLLAAGLGLMGLLPAAVAHDWTFGFAEDEAPISDRGPEGAVGILPELAAEMFEHIPGESMSTITGPWVRMQRWVESAEIDGFLTYPSQERQSYAHFSQTPAFVMDYGYLIFRRNHPRRDRFETARSFDDLEGLVFIGQQGAEWERDNIPSSLNTILVGKLDTMLHLLVRRQSGDFIVMPAEQTIAIARRLGYDDQLAYHSVEFIPNARIPFHVGLRRSHPEAGTFIERVDAVLRSPDYAEAADRIVSGYR